MDAVSLYSELIMLRMGDPPGQKKVRLEFPAWLVCTEDNKDENIFTPSQLQQDRLENVWTIHRSSLLDVILTSCSLCNIE